MTPSDPTRPARPRRFSAIKPPVKRPKAEVVPADAAGAAPEVEPPALETAAPVPETAAPAASSPPPRQKTSDEARIAKVMARAGLCSRRDAEAWILDGRVAINGTILDSPARNVGPGDAVTVDGYPIDKPERTRLFLFHKTRGLVTTAKDPEGRPTVFDALPEGLPRLMTIGRLDINTEGLLLLTNDGGLARLLELPATGWIRRYRVRANGTTDQAQLDALAKGITVEGVAYAGIAARLDRVQGANLWLTMGLKEGRNREIKRVLEHLGLAVTRLIRISYGPFQLGDLADNAVEEVRTRVLRDQLGTALAKQAGLDFDSPLDAERLPEPAPQAQTSGRRRDRKGDEPAQPSAGTPAEGPRRQTRRSATADRRGRPVAVERITTAGTGRHERPVTARRDSRPAAQGDAPARTRTLRQADAKRGREAEQARFRADGERPQGARARAPRDDRAGTDRPARSFADRPQSSQAASPRSRDGEHKGGERPGRSFADRPQSPRSAAPRSRDSDRPDGERPSRSFADRPPSRNASPRGDNDRAGRDRPARNLGKPQGRAGRGASEGNRTRSGGKPGDKSGGRPGGKGRPPRR